METQDQHIPMLELMLRPAFCVSNGRITRVNSAAAAYLLCQGDEITPLLATGEAEYETFCDGCLYLTLSLGTQTIGATVIAGKDHHLFVLDAPSEQAELQSLALAAKELREPLNAMMASAEQMLPSDDAGEKLAAQFNRRMYQALRIVSNMSDAAIFSQVDNTRQEFIEICTFFREILEKTAQQLQQADLHLHYSLPNQSVYTLADPQRLERAVYNLISNAAKHSATGDSIQVDISLRGQRLAICVTDHGPGIDPGVKGSIYSRFLRKPSLTDAQEGLGLGMMLVRSAAIAHGGTVLIDHPQGCGIRVTMTIGLRQVSNQIRTPILRIDYAGERDHGLQELADVLPAHLYSPKNIN